MKRQVALCASMVAIGFGVGLFVLSPLTRNVIVSMPDDVRDTKGQYLFVSPLLSCPEVEIDHLGNDEINELEEILQSKITEEREAGHISTAGLYFRQLKGGPWLGINHEATFFPRSLLKVPLVMAIYKQAEANPALYDARINYKEGSANVSQHFGKDVIIPGHMYSAHELIEATLAESDNNAALLLSHLVTLSELQETYVRLGVTPPNDGQDYTTDVRTYASFFRILYNATYNTPEDSEHILEHLSQASFKRGLVAGVPAYIKVAHKFGEQDDETGALSQLHDCGVIYHPTKPYLLCVMTTGKDFEQLARAIAELSRTTYNFIAR